MPEAARRLTALGVDMIWTGDDMGGQSAMVISPQMWRRFFKPRMAELVRRVKAINPDLKVAYHTDGDVRDVIPELIEIGIDVLNPVQPDVMDPAPPEPVTAMDMSQRSVLLIGWGSGYAKSGYYAADYRGVKRRGKKKPPRIRGGPVIPLANHHLPWTSSIAARRLRANLVNICSMLARLFSRVKSL